MRPGKPGIPRQLRRVAVLRRVYQQGRKRGIILGDQKDQATGGAAIYRIASFFSLTIAQAADQTQTQEEFNPAGLIFFLPFIAFYTAVAIIYLNQVKLPVKLMSIIVFVICAVIGDAAVFGAVFLITAVAGTGDITNTFAVLAIFAAGFAVSVGAGIGGVRLLGRFFPRYTTPGID